MIVDWSIEQQVTLTVTVTLHIVINTNKYYAVVSYLPA